MSRLGVEAHAMALAHRRAQAQLAGQFAGYTMQAVTDWVNGDLTDRDLVTMWLALSRAGHESSATRTAVFINQYRDLQGVREATPVVKPEWLKGDAAARASRMLQAMRQARDPRQMGQRFAASQAARVLDAGRDTVEYTTKAAHTTWRRVTGPDPCPFCAMLSTRSDYTSPETAVSAGGRHRRRHARPEGSRYHEHCMCTAVEVVGEWEPDDTEQQSIELYRKARRQVAGEHGKASTTDVLAAMRRLAKEES